MPKTPKKGKTLLTGASRSKKKPAPAKKARRIVKQSGDSTSSLAASILGGRKATQKDAKKLAGSVLSQDETKGKRKKKP